MNNFRISDRTMDDLRVLAHEILGSRTDSEAHEAVRAFLSICRHEGVTVDKSGELVPAEDQP